MKVIFVSRKGNETYNPEKHLTRIWNFLYWKSSENINELLLVGNGQYGLGNGSHQNLLICVRNNGCDIPNYQMDGAGNLGFDGKITGWKSTGFKVTTPGNLHSIILTALGATER